MGIDNPPQLPGPITPQGRLTLTTAVPVLIAAVTAATSVFYTPYNGSMVPIYNGANWTARSFAELTLAFTSNSGHTGYQHSGKNFDIFGYDSAGVLTLATGPAWTNDTTRADALVLQNGVLVNNASIVLRFGSAVGNTATVAAKTATYLGTMRASANGQTEFSFGRAASAGGTEDKWYLWNAYNRCLFATTVKDSTDSWAYATATWRATQGANTVRVSMVRGLDEEPISAEYACASIPGATGSVYVGAALDATNAFNGRSGAIGTLTIAGSTVGGFDQVPGLGYHYVQAVENGGGAATGTFYGDNGALLVQNGLTVRGWA